ncbi:MAG: hypothetical protein ACP5HM_06565 [Anaerolineae bacterium]
MKAGLWFGIGVVATLVVVLVVMAGGWLLWGRSVWGMSMFDGPGMMGGSNFDDKCDTGRWGGRGWGGMMGGSDFQSEEPFCAPFDDERSASPALELDLEAAKEAVHTYLDEVGYEDLEIAEVMEFERNFYVIVKESDTGVGAMELLVDRNTGAVGPEPGPNMMWNAKYGMHGRGMMDWRRTDLENTLTEDEVLEIAQHWLDSNRPGARADEHADVFHGYYTLHTLKDGEIDGMLSVHGNTGQVWYHTWHGDFIGMVEADAEHVD